MQIPGRRIEAGEEVVTASFPRGGDGMFLRAQMISDGSGGADPSTIHVYTRNSEEAWPDPSTTSGIASVTLGTTVNDVVELHIPVSTGIKEELRLKIKGPTSGTWSVIRIFPPLFYDTAVT